MKRIFASIIAVACCIGIATAQDIVYLNNGSIIKGSLTEIALDQKVTVQTQDGNQYAFANNEIHRVTKDKDFVVDTKFSAPKGYRGFAEFSPLALSAQNLISFNLSTTHGYQFNHNVFLGGGVGFNIGYTSDNPISIPVFAEFRGNVGRRQVQFTYGARLGTEYGSGYITRYDVANDALYSEYVKGFGVYSGLRVGMRIPYSQHCAINLSAMTTLAIGTFSNFTTGLYLGFEF